MTVRRYVLAILWAGLIITLTSLPSDAVPRQVSAYDKVGHFGMYAVFAWLLARDGFGVAGRWGSVLITIIVVSGFGAVDEWHQQYVPGRSTEYADWQADTAGAVVGALAQAIFTRRRARTSTT